MSSEWNSEILLAEAVANSVHINSLVLVNGIQLSQLMVACLHGNIDYVEALLEVPGVKDDLQNDEGLHALHCACMCGHTAIAQLILNTCQCQDLVNLPNKSKITCLMIASQNGHTETVLLLLQNGAHVNMQNSEGVSSLMIASQSGHTETVSLLLQNGAHVNMQNSKGSSSLMIASQNGHTETVSLLLENGAHVNMQNNKGLSSLMLTKSLTCSQLLIASGADMNLLFTMRTTRLTALTAAIARGNTDIALHLIDCGADISIGGLSALFYASFHNQISVVKHILDKENIVKNYLVDDLIDGYTPLMAASSCGHVDGC